MNVERIKQLRDFLDQLDPSRFHMKDWIGGYGLINSTTIHDCGTCACIGGWANLLFRNELPESSDYCWTVVGEHLDLEPSEVDALFFPSHLGVDYDAVTLPDAVQVLDNLISTGRVEWPDRVKL